MMTVPRAGPNFRAIPPSARLSFQSWLEMGVPSLATSVSEGTAVSGVANVATVLTRPKVSSSSVSAPPPAAPGRRPDSPAGART